MSIFETACCWTYDS